MLFYSECYVNSHCQVNRISKNFKKSGQKILNNLENTDKLEKRWKEKKLYANITNKAIAIVQWVIMDFPIHISSRVY